MMGWRCRLDENKPGATCLSSLPPPMTLGEGLGSPDGGSFGEKRPRAAGPLPQAATERRTPRTEVGGRGHTWQPLAAGHLGALCGTTLALSLAIPRTSWKAGRSSLQFGFYPASAHRDLYQAGKNPSPSFAPLPNPWLSEPILGRSAGLYLTQKLLPRCSCMLAPLEHSPGILSSI